jgi:hypothetical protein
MGLSHASPPFTLFLMHMHGVQPILSPYEAFVALDAMEWRTQYPMDFYSKDSGPWTNYFRPASDTEVEGRVTYMHMHMHSHIYLVSLRGKLCC